MTDAYPISEAKSVLPESIRIVDSHLHVWSSASKFAPGKEPPANLGDAVASAEAFAAAYGSYEEHNGQRAEEIRQETDHAFQQ